ncbi:MAG TPA: hypothetical protein VKA27_05395 [Sunxiuqinia sp.]|nr:hypothetical protein [Sunxiuqinia sp.]
MNVKSDFFSTPNLEAQYNSEHSILIAKLTDRCGNLMETDTKKEEQQISEIIDEKKPHSLLADLSACSYYTTGEHIRWYENTLFNHFKDMHVRKISIVVPGNLFVQASIEAARTSMENPYSDVQYFRDKEQAFNWLNL